MRKQSLVFDLPSPAGNNNFTFSISILQYSFRYPVKQQLDNTIYLSIPDSYYDEI